jgi:hypothetical protein
MKAIVRNPRFGVATATLVALAVLQSVGPAAAAPAGSQTLAQFSIGCDLLSGEFGAVSLYVDREFGDHASVAYWHPGSSPDHDAPTLVSTGATITFDGRVVGGVLSLMDPATEQPAGEATFRADLAPVGEPVVSRSKPSGFGASNDNVRILTQRQDADVTGWVALLDLQPLVLDGCVGGVLDRVIAYNNPAKFVEQVPARSSASCVQPGPDGLSLRLEIADFDGLGVELSVLDTSNEEELAYGYGEVSLVRDRLTATALMFHDGERNGEAVISAALGRGVPRRERGTSHEVRYSVFVRDRPLDGSVDVSGFGEFLLTGCSFTYERGWMQWPNPDA